MDVAMVKVVMYSTEWTVMSFNIDYVSIRVCIGMYVLVCMYVVCM